MVTIEQKLSVFSKLLHRSMNDRFTEEMEKLRKEYEIRIQKSKDAVDKEADDILSKSRKKAEAEKLELISKSRISMKKEVMSVKEKHFAIFMDHLKDEIEKFVLSEKYETYLLSQVKSLKGLGLFPNGLIIFLTNRDYERFEQIIKQELSEVYQADLSFKVTDDSIIGGFIAEDPVGAIRMNFTIDALLEDNMSYIMQTLFKAIEAGEANGI